jgi:hypothetical protein
MTRPIAENGSARCRSVTGAATVVALIVASIGLTLGVASGGASPKTHHGVFLKLGDSHPKQRPPRVIPPLINPPFGSKLAHWKRWSSRWSSRRTHSRGRLHYDTCRPSCAQGYHAEPGKVLLNGVRHCHGQRRYTKLHFRFDRHRKFDADIRVDCDGKFVHYHLTHGP